MKLSDKRRSRLYAAIHSAILDVRLVLQHRPEPLSAKDDATIAQVEHAIWHRVCKALNIERKS